MTALENLDILLRNLPNSTNVTLSLEELRAALTAVSPSDLTKVAPGLSFAILFGYLDTDDRNQLECCCDILKKLLEAVLPSVIVTNFKNELMTGLQHQSHYVADLCLVQISRVFKSNVHLIVEQSDIVQALIKLLASEEPGIASKASLYLIGIGSDLHGFQVLFDDIIMKSFKDILQRNSVVKYRVYEVLVKAIIQCSESVSFFESGCPDTSLLDMMISELSPENSDILGKLNILEFAGDLVSCLHGFNYLEKKGFITSMENSMEDALNDPFLANGYMKFFGSLCFVQPNLVNSRFKSFINAMFSSILKSSHTMAIAVESLGLIGSTPAGKVALHQSGQGMSFCLPVIGQLISGAPIELRLKALRSLQLLLSLPDEDYPLEILPITEEWFAKLEKDNLLAQILALCQQPFTELKTSALSVIKSLAKHQCGQVALKNNAGFQEYLLDRTENTKEGMIGKYEVVKALVRSPFTQQVFGNSYYLRLRAFERDGPYYMSSAPQVALVND